jgi:transposase
MTKLADMDPTELAAALKKRALDETDKQLKLIESRLADLQPLIELRDRLQASRRAMLNDRSVASGGGRGTSQAEVVAAMRDKDAMSVFDIAQAVGASEAVIRGHLNRGKDERFNKDSMGRWSLREPENDEEEDDDE